MGSSPRMRGTRRPSWRRCRRRGIIPAYAGNTLESIPRMASNGDHPRVCGEHSGEELAGLAVLGSSPRMRGTLCWGCNVHAQRGIIPAYAGNTSVSVIRTHPIRDHPRVCGEHTISDAAFAIPCGSSPRMRGTQYEPCRPCRQPGIIPAYAGNTQSGVRWSE